MKKIFKTMLLLAAVTTGIGTFTSCSSDNDLTKADALFRPIINENDNLELGLNENYVPYMIVKWDNYTDANQYTVRVIPVDASVAAKEVTTSDLTCRFDGLEYDKEYFVYISSANTNTGLSSKEFSLTTTTPDYPTALATPSVTDIIDTQVRIKWGEATYSNLKVYKDSNDSLVIDTLINDETIAAKEIILKGLNQKTTYRVEAYLSDTYQGKKRFTTTASESYKGVVFDLRELDEDVAKTYITTDQIAADVEANPGEDIVYVLSGGTTYKISGGTAIPATNKTVKFVTGLTLSGNAQFVSSGGFAIVKGADVYGLAFEKIDFISDKFEDAAAIAASKDKAFGGRQVFNINGVKSTLSSISFKNCSMQGYRAVVRSQADGDNITNITMEDCLINGIGDQGVLTSTNKMGVWEKVVLKNCTFTNIVMLCDFRSATVKNGLPMDMTIENCTFCYAPMEAANANTPLFRVGDNTTITVKNTLFGPAMASGIKPFTASSTGSVFVTGDPTVSVEQSYKTDFAWTSIGEGDAAKIYPLEGLTDLGISEAALWSAPASGNYSIIGKVSGVDFSKLGDSRWQ
ncbi:MAG: DUF4957 domain-containing protein [Prevotella sp.]|nr:DUF4957 domain-containing protein [Prevotella sp.]